MLRHDFRQHFDRNGPSQIRIARAIHLAQAAGAERAQNLEMCDRVRHARGYFFGGLDGRMSTRLGRLRCVVRHEIDHDLRDVFRAQLPFVAGIGLSHEVGVHRTGLDVADANAVVPHFLHQRFAERVDGRLRRAVRNAAHERIAPGKAADVDDVAAAAPPQMRDRRLAAVEDAGHVGVHHPAPVVVPLRFEAAEPSDAGVVDENIDAALPPRGLVDERLHGKMVAHVGRKGQHARASRRDAAELGFGFLEMIFLDAADRDVRALLKERRRNRAPDAARAARDDGDLTFERIGHQQTILTALRAVVSHLTGGTGL